MGFRYQIARASNTVLSRFGARLEKTGATQQWQFDDLNDRYDRNVLELYQCLISTQFTQLPVVAGRANCLCKLVGTNISEAVWLLDSLHGSMAFDGDVCEFGIAEGATSALLANEIRATEKKLWLFDSFEGLSQPTSEDELIDDIFDLGSMEAYAGKMKYDISEVQGRFAAIEFPIERVAIVPGFIEDSLKRNHLPTGVSFAYVDFDFYQPILDALHFLHRVITLGGSIVVDDYGFFSSGAKKAVDEFHESYRDSYELVLPPEWAGHFAIFKRIVGRQA